MLAAIVCGAESGDFQTALALYAIMSRPESGFTPTLVSKFHSGNVECLTINGLLDYFRLWRWLRNQEKLLVIAIGKQNLKLAKLICKMRKKNTTLLACVFAEAVPPKLGARDLASFQLCICSSEHVRQTVQTSAKTDCVTVAPGIDICDYKTAATKDGNRIIFGMAQSLEPDSGALLLIRAMSALWQQHDLTAWEVRLFGGGPRFEEVMIEAEKLGVLSRLSILGTQPLPEVISYCHVWIAPGTSPVEAPETLWAGFAAGIPVICTDSQLHSERILDKSAILQVNENNPQELAKAMLTLARNRQLANELARAALKMRPEISLEAMAARITTALNNYFEGL